MNFVGNIVGGSAQSALSGVTLTPQIVWPTTRAYTGTVYGTSWGYETTGDTGSGSLDTAAPYTTALIHGLYNNISGTTTWYSGLTHTLPASFYLSSEPVWFGASAWPPIGPDVTGSGASPHVTAIPAQVCYSSIGGLEGGAGGPYNFNADSCYPTTAAPAGGLINHATTGH